MAIGLNIRQKKWRVLLIGQDRLFRSENFVVDYIPTGLKMTPLSDREDKPARFLTTSLRAAVRACQSSYDFVVFPAIHFSLSKSEPRCRTQFRWLIRNILSTGVARSFFRRGTPVLILDRFDRLDIAEDFAQMVGATLYLKTNLRLSQRGSRLTSGCLVDFLPYWVESDRYVLPSVEKDIDVFFAGRYASSAREVALDELKTIQNNNVRVVTIRDRLSMPDYLAYLRRSLITLSAEGGGYHCFRQYEAMLMESVPLVNLPEVPVSTDLVHGQTCLQYDATVSGHLKEIVSKALNDRGALQNWGCRLRGYASENHSIEAVSDYILHHVCQLKNGNDQSLISRDQEHARIPE